MTTSLYDLTPGARVVVQSPAWAAGQAGVVVDAARKSDVGYEYDVAVLLDKDNVRDDIAALGFYAHELAVEK